MENWILISILAGLFSSIFNYGFRYLIKDGGDSTSLSWWFELGRVLILLPILPFSFYLNPNFQTLLLLLLIGLVEFVSVYYYAKMHKENHLSVSTIIIRLRVVWIPILAFLFIREELLPLNYLGIMIVFIGLSFVSTPKQLIYDKGIFISLICSIITAVNTILVKMVSSDASPTVVVLAMSLPSVFLFPIFVKNWRSRVKTFYESKRLSIFSVAGASVITTSLLSYALSLGPAGKVSGIFQGMSFVAVLAGIFILGEKEKVWQKIIGSIVVIVGAYLLV